MYFASLLLGHARSQSFGNQLATALQSELPANDAQRMAITENSIVLQFVFRFLHTYTVETSPV